MKWKMPNMNSQIMNGLLQTVLLLLIVKTEYFIAYSITIKNKTVSDIKTINFKLDSKQTRIYKVLPWADSNLVVIVLENENYLILVWDIINNKEVSNYSCDSFKQHVNGKSSEAGYILCSKFYVNLDLGIENHFFEHDFSEFTPEYRISGGFKMNQSEDCILDYGNLIRKETMLELDIIKNYINNDQFKLDKDNICLDRIKFNVDGNSVIHYFADNTESLRLVMDYMEEYKREYLLAILMKNKEEKSPIDLAIENESLLCIELMLK